MRIITRKLSIRSLEMIITELSRLTLRSDDKDEEGNMAAGETYSIICHHCARRRRNGLNESGMRGNSRDGTNKSGIGRSTT